MAVDGGPLSGLQDGLLTLAICKPSMRRAAPESSAAIGFARLPQCGVAGRGECCAGRHGGSSTSLNVNLAKLLEHGHEGFKVFRKRGVRIFEAVLNRGLADTV